ncbi:hypothetical protein JCGZ_06469 [Jatropha curcas]|uniref:Uncharacterized protein n=1 Tax=Jatropha curcas TaxID=180498 RepID=A0A067JK24_JATCU|nr:hypothetical protein JCGZ_06469 [Jatropha curcas]
MLKVAREKLYALRYTDFTFRMLKSGKKQQCMSQEIWESWQKAWEDPVFKRKYEITGTVRLAVTEQDLPDTQGDQSQLLEKQLVELGVHVMRMSSSHSVDPSSSDPPPATDPHVFTLHQPPSSPLHPDIADDTSVTLADTTTNLADTTPDHPED